MHFWASPSSQNIAKTFSAFESIDLRTKEGASIVDFCNQGSRYAAGIFKSKLRDSLIYVIKLWKALIFYQLKPMIIINTKHLSFLVFRINTGSLREKSKSKCTYLLDYYLHFGWQYSFSCTANNTWEWDWTSAWVSVLYFYHQIETVLCLYIM